LFVDATKSLRKKKKRKGEGKDRERAKPHSNERGKGSRRGTQRNRGARAELQYQLEKKHYEGVGGTIREEVKRKVSCCEYAFRIQKVNQEKSNRGKKIASQCATKANKSLTWKETPYHSSVKKKEGILGGRSVEKNTVSTRNQIIRYSNTQKTPSKKKT